MNEYGIVIVEQLREFWHDFNEAVMRFAFWKISIRKRRPNPLNVCRASHVAVPLRSFAFFEQGDNVRASHLTQKRKIDAAGTMIHGKSSFADGDKFDV